MLQIRQLDATLEAFRDAKQIPMPKQGWVSEIRRALGMSARQLGKRLGKTQSAIAVLERGEADGRITIGSLRDLAEGLNCQLVYAVVPKTDNLNTLLRRAVEAYARQHVQSVSRTMALEEQAVSDSFLNREVADLVADWMKRPPRNLWDVVAPR